jgi:hypothetical protein
LAEAKELTEAEMRLREITRLLGAYKFVGGTPEDEAARERQAQMQKLLKEQQSAEAAIREQTAALEAQQQQGAGHISEVPAPEVRVQKLTPLENKLKELLGERGTIRLKLEGVWDQREGDIMDISNIVYEPLEGNLDLERCFVVDPVEPDMLDLINQWSSEAP